MKHLYAVRMFLGIVRDPDEVFDFELATPSTSYHAIIDNLWSISHGHTRGISIAKS